MGAVLHLSLSALDLLSPLLVRSRPDVLVALGGVVVVCMTSSVLGGSLATEFDILECSFQVLCEGTTFLSSERLFSSIHQLLSSGRGTGLRQ